MEKLLGVPLPPSPVAVSPYSKNGHSPGAMNPLVDDEAARAWGKAIYRNNQSNDKDISRSLTLPALLKRVGSYNSRSKSHPSGDLKAKGREPSLFKKGDEFGDDSPTSYKNMMAKKEEVLEDWERELQKCAQNAKAKSRIIVKNAKCGPDRRFPASWSRFPSHNREERVAAAGSSDRVEQRDFAIAGIKDGKKVWYHSERTNHLYHHEGEDFELHRNTPKKGFLERWEKKIRDKLSQVESVQTDIFLDRTHGRRGSLITEMPAKYPDLELLPIEMMTTAQIEAQVEEQMAEEMAQRKEEELDTAFGKSAAMAGQSIDRPKKLKIAPEKMEMIDLTPTKSTKERRAARLSRKGWTLPKLSRQPTKRLDIGDRSNRLQQSYGPSVMKKSEVSDEMTIEERVAEWRARSEKPGGTLDGHVGSAEDGACDQKNDLPLEETPRGIADPEFYDDFIVTSPADEGADGDGFEEVSPKSSTKDRFMTWSGKDWDGYKYNAGAMLSPRRALSTGTLRKSTDDFHGELQKMERFEMEKALRIAEEAWGSVNR